MAKTDTPRLIVAAKAEGDIVDCREGLSFWGGVDPDTGVVIDAHHPLNGVSLAGKLVLMPTSRGSCSGSGVLLELAMNGHAPSALVFKEDEEVLTLGALIAQHMCDRTVGVIRLPAEDYDRLSCQEHAAVSGTRLATGGTRIDLDEISSEDLALSAADIATLNGDHGKPAKLAMTVLTAMAASQGADRLIDVTRGHIDGCIYAHRANLVFAEAMADMGAKVAIPTTINAISVDRERWEDHDLPPDFGRAACRLADAYVKMGAQPTFTCAPYFLDDVPEKSEQIGWSESNAVIYANSVLGARTAKHPDYLDLFIAMTGRAPETGVYLTENRRPQAIVDVELPGGYDDAIWPLLGWLAGQRAPDRIPVLRGLECAALQLDDLRAICAAFGTTSAAPMLHVAGVTPEHDLDPTANADHQRIGMEDFRDAWAGFNKGPGKIDLIALGSPHMSLEEVRRFASELNGATVHPETAVILTLGRGVLAACRSEGLASALEDAGVRLIADLCWCSIVEPIFPPDAKVLMTNSGKYAHYAPGLSGRSVRFGSLRECAQAALTGHAPDGPPGWLR